MNTERPEKVFCERFNSLLDICQLTGKAVAEKIGVTAPALSAYKRGELIPKAVTLIEISRLFDVSVDWLLGLTDIRGKTHEVY